MKSRYTLHVEQGYVESVFEGPVTLVEMGLHVQEVWGDPAWKPTFNGLLDFSRASVDMTDDDMRALMKSMLRDPRCSLARFAFVVATAEEFAMIRKFDILTEALSTIRIFFNRSEALQWLLHPPQGKQNPPGK